MKKLFFLLIIPFLGFAQEWIKSYSVNINSLDFFHDVIQTSDGGYLCVGGTNANGGLTNAWVVKTNSEGAIEFSNIVDPGNANNDVFYAVEEVEGEGYYLCGTKYFKEYERAPRLTKIDFYGNTIWDKHYEIVIGGSSGCANGSVTLNQECEYFQFDTSNCLFDNPGHSTRDFFGIKKTNLRNVNSLLAPNGLPALSMLINKSKFNDLLDFNSPDKGGAFALVDLDGELISYQASPNSCVDLSSNFYYEPDNTMNLIVEEVDSFNLYFFCGNIKFDDDTNSDIYFSRFSNFDPYGTPAFGPGGAPTSYPEITLGGYGDDYVFDMSVFEYDESLWGGQSVILVGSTTSYGNSAPNLPVMLFLRINMDSADFYTLTDQSSTVWQETYGLGGEKALFIDQTTDGNFIILGIKEDSTLPFLDEDKYILIKINPSGNILWSSEFYLSDYNEFFNNLGQSSYDTMNNRFITDLSATSDGGFVLCGGEEEIYTLIPGNSNNDGFLIKFGANYTPLSNTQNDVNKIKTLTGKVDILGRKNTNNKGFQLHIYDDGSVEKKYVTK